MTCTYRYPAVHWHAHMERKQSAHNLLCARAGRRLWRPVESRRSTKSHGMGKSRVTTSTGVEFRALLHDKSPSALHAYLGFEGAAEKAPSSAIALACDRSDFRLRMVSSILFLSLCRVRVNTH